MPLFYLLNQKYILNKKYTLIECNTLEMRYFNVTGNQPYGGHDAYRKNDVKDGNGMWACAFVLNLFVYRVRREQCADIYVERYQ